MAKRRSWVERYGKPCKIGTIPNVVQVHGKDWGALAVGKTIRIREQEGAHWITVRVTRVDPDGYFMADK